MSEQSPRANNRDWVALALNREPRITEPIDTSALLATVRDEFSADT